MATSSQYRRWGKNDDYMASECHPETSEEILTHLLYYLGCHTQEIQIHHAVEGSTAFVKMATNPGRIIDGVPIRYMQDGEERELCFGHTADKPRKPRLPGETGGVGEGGKRKGDIVAGRRGVREEAAVADPTAKDEGKNGGKGSGGGGGGEGGSKEHPGEGAKGAGKTAGGGVHNGNKEGMDEREKKREGGVGRRHGKRRGRRRTGGD